MPGRRLFVPALLLAAACAKPIPPSPPPPPPLEVVPSVPPEALSLAGRTWPLGSGAQAVEILVNDQPVIRGSLSERSPHDTLHGEYEGHTLIAQCTLAVRIQCAISVDGELQDSEMR